MGYARSVALFSFASRTPDGKGVDDRTRSFVANNRERENHEWWIAANSAHDVVGCLVTVTADSQCGQSMRTVSTNHQRAITVIFFEYTGGLCGICMSSPINSCSVCLPGGNEIIVSVSPAPKCR